MTLLLPKSKKFRTSSKSIIGRHARYLINPSVHQLFPTGQGSCTAKMPSFNNCLKQGRAKREKSFVMMQGLISG